MATDKNNGTKAKPRGRGFKKGQSGNPAGRPKGAINVATREWKEVARSLVEDEQVQANVLARLRQGRADKIFIKLCDYAYGVPKTPFVLEDPTGANPFAAIVESIWKAREGGDQS